MQLPPTSVTFQWPTPNYVNPIDRGRALVVVALLFTTITTIIILLRVYTRLAISRSHGTDDGLIGLVLVRNLHGNVLSSHVISRPNILIYHVVRYQL
jgi:hypothetical protein